MEALMRTDNIRFRVIDGNKKDNIVSADKVRSESKEVYAFRTKEEIQSMIDVFDQKIRDSSGESRRIASRNKLLFLIGINIGLRASDLRSLKWSFFLDKDEEGCYIFKNGNKVQPEKTKRYHKFVSVYFGNAVINAIKDYIGEYPIKDLDTYLFTSRKKTGRVKKDANGNVIKNDILDIAGNAPISEKALWQVIKDTAAEAGIKQNIGSHSLRKTFGFWRWHEAENKSEALVYLQQLFSHSNTMTTMKYIGIMDQEIEKLFKSVELG